MTDATPPLEGTPLIAPSSTDHTLYDSLVEACRTVYDPEIPVNIYDLGLIYTINANDENEVKIARACRIADFFIADKNPKPHRGKPLLKRNASTPARQYLEPTR